MKLIIAGSRDIQIDDAYQCIVDIIFAKDFPFNQVTEIVSGCCEGVDKAGELLAVNFDIPIKEFPANWKVNGRAAGPIRNAAMAKYGDILIAITKGSRGTANMIENMQKLNKPVYIKYFNE